MVTDDELEKEKRKSKKNGFKHIVREKLLTKNSNLGTLNVDAHGKPSTMVSVRGACGDDANPKQKQYVCKTNTKRKYFQRGSNIYNMPQDTKIHTDNA